MATATERFLRYVSFDTQSADGANAIPSTQKQFDLANALVQEMREMGIHDARVDEHCYVYGSLPATVPDLPALGYVVVPQKQTALVEAACPNHTFELRGF